MTDDGEGDISRAELATPFFNILHPLVVLLEAIGRDTDDLDITSSKVRCSVKGVHFRAQMSVASRRTHLLATSASSVVQTGVKSPG